MSPTPVREHVSSKAEILCALEAALGAAADWIEAQPDARFGAGPAGRWSMGQHLEHLIRSVKPINLGLSLPKFAVGLALGTSDRPSMTYAETAARYEAGLEAGGKASGRFVPPAVRPDAKAALLARHRKERDRLLRLLGRWSEADLDHYAAPHPLLGKLTLRELLFFTAHHHDHHLATLQRDYAGPADSSAT